MKPLAIALVLVGCQDALDQRLAIVTEPRVLAIISEPPEAKPGDAVTYQALVAGPTGPITDPPSWALCTAPKPPTEDNAVADGCLGNDQLAALGTGTSIMTTLPADACLVYGPDVASSGFRPRDPDPTGGYYQPVRAALPNIDLAFGFSRITCNLAQAPGDVAQDYKTMYVANQNPIIHLLELRDPALVVGQVRANAEVTISASWLPTSVETYLYYDPDSQRLVTRREAMRVSWFATGGSLAVDASAVAETDDTLEVSTTWRTPTEPGPAWIWLVLRDSRGGIATASVTVDVQ